MAYASTDQLAEALEIRVTPENAQVLGDCLEAAATEIDHFLDGQPITDPAPAMIVRTNVNRAVEWYKAPATYNGGVGTVEIGVLNAPSSGFERHSAALLPFQISWGLA
jgi:hypothetical protein